MPENNLDRPPLFSVGQEVLLNSISYPELNGDCVVTEVKFSLCPMRGWGYGYRTTINAPSGRVWDEGALSKKHKPSEHSFDSLIADLKSKEPINAKA